MSIRQPTVIALGLCALLATPASANAGTPLMWLGMIHLVVLNLCIGLIEAAILWKGAHARFLRAALVMIPANYASALFGYSVLLPWARARVEHQSGLPIDHAAAHLWTFILLTFILTLLVEAPFAIIAAWKRAAPRRTLLAFVLAQVMTYAGMLVLYGVASPRCALDLPRDHTMSFIERGHPARVYYIDDADGDLWRVNLDGSSRERIGTIGLFKSPMPAGQPALSEFDRAFFQTIDTESRESGCYRLVAARPGTRDDRIEVLIEELPHALGPNRQPGVDFNDRDTRPESERHPLVRGGFWAAEGMVVTPANTPPWKVAYETPLDAWEIRRLTVLPGNLAVFDFGPRQICVLDLETRTIGVLAHGRSNVVTMPGVLYEDDQAR